MKPRPHTTRSCRNYQGKNSTPRCGGPLYLELFRGETHYFRLQPRPTRLPLSSVGWPPNPSEHPTRHRRVASHDEGTLLKGCFTCAICNEWLMVHIFVATLCSLVPKFRHGYNVPTYTVAEDLCNRGYIGIDDDFTYHKLYKVTIPSSWWGVSSHIPGNVFPGICTEISCLCMDTPYDSLKTVRCWVPIPPPPTPTQPRFCRQTTHHIHLKYEGWPQCGSPRPITLHWIRTVSWPLLIWLDQNWQTYTHLCLVSPSTLTRMGSTNAKCTPAPLYSKYKEKITKTILFENVCKWR